MVPFGFVRPQAQKARDKIKPPSTVLSPFLAALVMRPHVTRSTLDQVKSDANKVNSNQGQKSSWSTNAILGNDRGVVWKGYEPYIKGDIIRS